MTTPSTGVRLDETHGEFLRQLIAAKTAQGTGADFEPGNKSDAIRLCIDAARLGDDLPESDRDLIRAARTAVAEKGDG